MTTDIVAEARSWLGTPFVPQQSVKGSGCDCKGLLAGVARELGRPEARHVHALTRDYDLNRVPRRRLKEGLAELLDPVAAEDMRPGDVLLLRKGRVPVHLAVVTAVGEDGRAVHASPEDGTSETQLGLLLHDWPLDSVWRFRPCR